MFGVLNLHASNEIAKQVTVKLLKEALSMQQGTGSSFMMGFLSGSNEVIKYSALVEILVDQGKKKLFSATFEELLELELAKWTSLSNPTCKVFETACSRNTSTGVPLILQLLKPSLISKLCMKRPFRSVMLKILQD